MKHLKKIIVIIITGILMFGCITYTDVTFESNIEGADLYIDGEYIGEMPLQVSLSNAIWEDTNIRVTTEGFKESHKKLEKVIQPVNLVVGWFLFPPSLLYCYGPDSYQYYRLFPVEE